MMNFTSVSGKCLGAAAHEVNTLPPRINAQDVTCLSVEWAAAASKISSRNQSVYVILDGFAMPSTVLWSRSAGNKVRRRLRGKTCVASRWFEKRMTTKLKKVVLKKDEQLKGNAYGKSVSRLGLCMSYARRLPVRRS